VEGSPESHGVGPKIYGETWEEKKKKKNLSYTSSKREYSQYSDIQYNSTTGVIMLDKL